MKDFDALFFQMADYVFTLLVLVLFARVCGRASDADAEDERLMRAAGIDQAVLKPFGAREICSA